MKLRLFIAVGVGAAAVVVGGWYCSLDQHTGRPSSDGPVARATREALAFLKASHSADAPRPAVQASSSVEPSAEVGAAAQAPAVAETQSPGSTAAEAHTLSPQQTAEYTPPPSAGETQPQANDAAVSSTIERPPVNAAEVAALPSLYGPAPSVVNNTAQSAPNAEPLLVSPLTTREPQVPLMSLLVATANVTGDCLSALMQPAAGQRDSVVALPPGGEPLSTTAQKQPLEAAPSIAGPVGPQVAAAVPAAGANDLTAAPRLSPSTDFALAPESAGPPQSADTTAVPGNAAPGPVQATEPAASEPITLPPSQAVAAETLSPEMLELKAKIRRVLDLYRNRRLNTRDNGAWEIMHSFIAYGVAKEVDVGGPGGQRANAIGWLCFNGPAAGERLFVADDEGPVGRTGPGLQGHRGQFLGMLAQSKVPMDYPMKVDGHNYTVADLVHREQLSCRPRTELTFELIGLMHYLKSDATWQDDTGDQWDIPRLVREELAQPIIGATCGGTHRLFALTSAYKKRLQRGEPVDGQYARAQIFIRDYQNYTFKLQNPDGSFSTNFFAGRGASPDLQRRLETTGHISEWLTFSLDKEQLREPRMVKAMNYLADLLQDNSQTAWKVGPLGHALHALNMYYQYVFEPTGSPSSPVTLDGGPDGFTGDAAGPETAPGPRAVDDDPPPAP